MVIFLWFFISPEKGEFEIAKLIALIFINCFSISEGLKFPSELWPRLKFLNRIVSFWIDLSLISDNFDSVI